MGAKRHTTLQDCHPKTERLRAKVLTARKSHGMTYAEIERVFDVPTTTANEWCEPQVRRRTRERRGIAAM